MPETASFNNMAEILSGTIESITKGGGRLGGQTADMGEKLRSIRESVKITVDDMSEIEGAISAMDRSMGNITEGRAARLFEELYGITDRLFELLDRLEKETNRYRRTP